MQNDIEGALKKTIEERFSVLLQPVVYIPKGTIKDGLFGCVKTTSQTVKQITQTYNRSHKTPVSRVRANTLLNELEAENSGIQIEREDGRKYFLRVD